MNLQKSVSAAVHTVLENLKLDKKKKPTRKLGVGGLVSRPKDAIAEKVDVAFKAPVSMTVVPFFVQTVPKVMFLHVLRDGRDIAFSHNQVIFYQIMIMIMVLLFLYRFKVYTSNLTLFYVY